MYYLPSSNTYTVIEKWTPRKTQKKIRQVSYIISVNIPQFYTRVNIILLLESTLAISGTMLENFNFTDLGISLKTTDIQYYWVSAWCENFVHWLVDFSDIKVTTLSLSFLQSNDTDGDSLMLNLVIINETQKKNTKTRKVYMQCRKLAS